MMTHSQKKSNLTKLNAINLILENMKTTNKEKKENNLTRLNSHSQNKPLLYPKNFKINNRKKKSVFYLSKPNILSRIVNFSIDF